MIIPIGRDFPVLVISEKILWNKSTVVVHFLAVSIVCVNIAVVEWSFWGLNICLITCSLNMLAYLYIIVFYFSFNIV